MKLSVRAKRREDANLPSNRPANHFSQLLSLGVLSSTATALPFDYWATEVVKERPVTLTRRAAVASWQPSSRPSSAPSWTPSSAPSWTPSSAPSWTPSAAASWVPSSTPSQIASSAASQAPSQAPSSEASKPSSSTPSSSPSAAHHRLRPAKAPAKVENPDIYVMYNGDGTTADGWPEQSSWVDFDTMWKTNGPLISGSCTQFDQANNSPEETEALLHAINSVSSSTELDPRFILAIVLQESNGCVRAPTTHGSVSNPGLMQSYEGTGSCNNLGTVQKPCPASEILQMIEDGTLGTRSGPGLVQDLGATDVADVSQYYMAARIYNSGSIPLSGDLEGPGATPCYASDVANRLTGWVRSESQCGL